MGEFFRIGGFSMIPVLLCGLAALVVAIYATGRPSRPLIAFGDRLARAELFFALSGLVSNVAATLYTVANTEHSAPDALGQAERSGDAFSMMLVTGLYESTAPGVMGLSFLALVHLALAIAAFRLARRAS